MNFVCVALVVDIAITYNARLGLEDDSDFFVCVCVCVCVCQKKIHNKIDKLANKTTCYMI